MEFLLELARDAANTARVNGFDKPTWDTLPVKVMFAVTEVVEAIDAAMSFNAFTEEVADIALRTLAILYDIWGNNWNQGRIEARNYSDKLVLRFQSAESLLFPALKHLALSIEAWRHNNDTDAKIRLELTLLELWRISDVYEFNLLHICRDKIQKNKERGHLHGKNIRSEG